jgi:hypothetical protein
MAGGHLTPVKDNALPSSPRTLGQLIAVERAVRQQDNEHGSQIKHVGKESTVTGLSKIYKATNEHEQFRLPPPQFTEVQRRIEDLLDEARKYSVSAMDAVASKDRTNQSANADVLIDGDVFLPQVPMSHLLWLENYLGEWKGYLASLPTLKPDKTWEYDSAQRFYRSRPEVQNTTRKETRALVLHAPTDKHPAQTTTVVEDIQVGTVETVTLSGAIPESRKKELLDRLTTLLLAVKDAIAVANRTPVVEVHEGEKVLGFILGR